MNQRHTVLAALLLATITAAGSAASARADGFTDFVGAVAAGKPSGHLATCDVLVTPDGRVHRPCALALTDLVPDATGVTLVVKRNKTAALVHSQYNAREAVVEARQGKKVIATFDVVEVFGYGNPDAPDSDAPEAVMWSRQITDKAATAAARAGTLPTPPAIADYKPAAPKDESTWTQDVTDAQSGFDWVRQSVAGATDYRAILADNVKSGAVVLGSGPGQRYAGKAGAKTVAGWKIALAQEGGVDTSGTGWLSVAVTHMVGTTTGKTASKITYVVMVVNTQFMTGGGSPAPQLSLVKFAIVP